MMTPWLDFAKSLFIIYALIYCFFQTTQAEINKKGPYEPPIMKIDAEVLGESAEHVTGQCGERIRFSVTVDPHNVPAGEIVRVTARVSEVVRRNLIPLSDKPIEFNIESGYFLGDNYGPSNADGRMAVLWQSPRGKYRRDSRRRRGVDHTFTITVLFREERRFLCTLYIPVQVLQE